MCSKQTKMKTRSQTKEKNKEKDQKKSYGYNLENIEIQEFDWAQLDDMDHNPSIILSGQRHSGKNVLMQELIYRLDRKFKYQRIFAFSMTDHITNGLPFMRTEDIFQDLSNLSKIINIRRKNIEDNAGIPEQIHPESRKDIRGQEVRGIKTSIEKKDKKIGNILIILNDIQGMMETKGGTTRLVKQSKSLEELYVMGRHFKISVIQSVQRAKSMVSKLQRANADMTFIWTPKSWDECLMVKNEYLGLCGQRQDRDAVFSSVFGKPYASLVVLGYKPGVISVDQYVYWYIAPYPERRWKAKYLKKFAKYKPSKRKVLKNMENFNMIQ